MPLNTTNKKLFANINLNNNVSEKIINTKNVNDYNTDDFMDNLKELIGEKKQSINSDNIHDINNNNKSTHNEYSDSKSNNNTDKENKDNDENNK